MVEEYKKTILIIDKDFRIREILRKKLTSLGYKVILASNGQEGLFIFNKEDKLNLIILDILLSKLDGYELCKKIREQSQIPIIIITALGSISERVIGLNLGADDYIIKPFSPTELEARVRSILRRSHSQLPKQKKIKQKIYLTNLIFDIQKRQILRRNTLIRLTEVECNLFKILIENAGKKLSRETIIANLWGYTPERYVDTRIVDVNISRLREKIEDIPGKPTFILTVRGIGYMFKKY